MSEGLIVRRGGTGGKVFAFIVVTYPEGSTCTCSDGSKTLRAKDTSGSFAFVVPYAATWTVTCTDGTSISSKTVLISLIGDSVHVVLGYELYLFESGVGYGSNFGWGKKYYIFNHTVGSSSVDVSQDQDHVYLFASVNASAVIGTIDEDGECLKIDVTDFDTLYCEWEHTSTESWGNGAQFGVYNDPILENTPVAYYSNINAESRTIHSVDISSLTGEYYIAAGTRDGNNMTIYNFWLA